MRRFAGAGCLAVLLVLPLAATSGTARTPPAAAPILQHLRGIDDLRARFDADWGNIRIVLLLSPT